MVCAASLDFVLRFGGGLFYAARGKWAVVSCGIFAVVYWCKVGGGVWAREGEVLAGEGVGGCAGGRDEGGGAGEARAGVGRVW